MRIKSGFLALIAVLLMSSNAVAQSVNDKVTKDNLNQVFLKSLIIERINEIRSYKKSPELQSNKVCQAAAKDQVAYMIKSGKATSEQDVDGFGSVIERVTSFGGNKKSKSFENIAEISMEGPITYMDLSDEITSKWISEKESTKNIENKNLVYEGIAFGIDEKRKMLVCSQVYSDKAVGSNLVIPEKPKDEVKEEAKDVVADAVNTEKKESEKEVAKEAATVKEEKKPVVEDKIAAAKAAEAKKEVVAEPKMDVADADPMLEDEDMGMEEEPSVPVEETKPAKVAAAASANVAASKETVSEPMSEEASEVELPACISPKKYERLTQIAKYGIICDENTVSMRAKYLDKLQKVVTSDMDGIGLIVDQNHDFEDGPTVFDYSALTYQKVYKSSLFGNLAMDYKLKDFTSDPADPHFSLKIKYIRKGIECYDVPLTCRTKDFDDELAIAEELAKQNASSVPAKLELVWDGNIEMDTKDRTYKNVSIKIPFKKGRANYSPSELIAIMDTLVEPGFKIVAADVIAHSSVEGNPERNKALAKLRGKKVIEALRELNGGTLFYGRLETNDSWDTFFEDIKATEFAADVEGKSKEDVEAMLKPGSGLGKKMESFLKTQRFAMLNLSLEYKSQKEVAQEASEERVIQNIYYDFGKFYIRKEAGKSLDVFSRLLKQESDYNLVEIGAHTDSRGSYSFNEKLSQRRAQAVVDYLISKGIDRQRLVPKGYGESELLNHCNDAADCSEAEHQRNRRTTFRILKEGGEISSEEPDDISVDYAPSFRPEDGLIDLRKEMATEISKKNGDGAARVYRKILKRVIVGQLPDDYAKLDSVPMDTAFVSVLLNNLIAKELILKETDLMGAVDALVQLSPTNPHVIYNGMAFKLMKDQGFVNALKADAAKKGKVIGILSSLKGTEFPQEKLDALISFVGSL